MARTDFTHLHVHTEFSMLDGLDPIDAYIARAKQMGQPALAITDHGNLCGAPQFYRGCRDAGIKPLLGCEFYFTLDAARAKEEKIQGERNHITMMARNEAGFRLLVELSTESHKRYYYKPLIDRALLESIPKKDRRNLTVLSGCAGSIISQKAMGWIEGDPVEETEWWSGLFPNFYMELMSHKTAFDRKLNRGLLRVADTLEIPWVVTNDPHYVMEEDCTHHDALLAVQTAADIDDPNRFRFEGEGYWLKSRAEMAKAFKKYGDDVWKPGAANTMRIAQETDIQIPDWNDRSWHIPKYKDSSVDSDALLEKLARKGMRRRGLKGKEEYELQLKHEVGKFREVPGMADFLLITWEVLTWAKKQGMRVGPGRGSIAGTLVGYLIGLHKVDPIKYELLFERFLNPERPKMPDVDSDFAPLDREPVVEHIKAEYGAENVTHVAAYQTMQLKRAFQSFAGAHGIPFQQRLALAKKIEEDAEGDVIWPEEITTGYPELIKQINRISGIKGSLASHPAGILIFDPNDDVRKYVPLMWIPNSTSKEKGKFVAQYDLKSTDFMFLLKQDILGLRNIATINTCLQYIEERYEVTIEPDDWVPNEEPKDDKVYKMLSSGQVNGVFQMEGYANRTGIQQIGCKEFEDIVTCTSMYRAGPMSAGAPDRFMKNRRDGKVRVIHPSMQEILSKTWGEMIYQEQMFRILNECAGLSWSRVDDVKTAVTKKSAEMMAAVMEDTIRGLVATSGFSPDQAARTWDMIAAQATYLFNRSHAVAYSFVSYQTARLKFLYPLGYLAACLATVEGKNDADKAKRHSYLSEAVQRGYRVLPPCINRSSEHARPEGRDGIRLGFVDIKGVGEAAARKILDRRPEEGFTKKWQAKGATASNVFTGLREAGALQDLGMPPDPGLQETRLAWQFYDPLADHRDVLEQRHKPAKGDGGYATLCGIIVKVDKRKTKKGNHFMKWTIRWKPGEEYAITLWDSTEGRLWKLKEGSIVTVSGRWSAQWSNMAIDDEDSVRVRVAVLEGGSAAPARS